MSRTKGDDGFTLLEMLIVIAVAGLVASSAILWFPTLSDRLLTDRLANNIVQFLSRAAAIAQTTGRDQTISLNSDARALLSSAGERLALDDGFSVSWRSAREIQQVSADRIFVLFATGGSTGGSLEITHGATRATVEVDWLTGHVREIRRP